LFSPWIFGFYFDLLGLIFAIMMFRVLVSSFLFTGFVWGHKHDVVKGFEALDAKNFGIAYSIFKESQTSFPSIASFGLFKLFYETKEFRSIDSAAFYLHRSLDFYASDSIRVKSNKRLNFESLGWTRRALWEHYQALAYQQFQVLLNAENLREITNFLEMNPQFRGRVQAERYRDSLWLDFCDNRDLFCVLGLKTLSPSSYFEEEIERQLDIKSFEGWVVNNSETELSTFIQYHPFSRYVVPAQDELFRIFLQKQDTNEYKRFLVNYPSNRNLDKVWKAYFHASIGNYDPSKMLVFLALHSDYPYKNQVLQELKWYGKSLFPIMNEKDLYGFMDEEGRVVVDFAFEEVNDFHEGLAAVMKNSRYGVITTNGEVAVEFVYDLISDFQAGHAIVKIEDKFGLIDRNGKTVIPSVYEDLQFIFADLLLFLEDGQYGVMNVQGQRIISPKFQEFLPISENFALVSDGQGKGVLRSSLDVLIPCQNEEIRLLDQGFMVKNQGKLGVVDFFGRQVVSCQFDELIPTVFPYLLVRKENKFFHLSTKDWRTVTVPTDVFEGWKDISIFNGSNFLIQRKGSKFWVDTTGRLTKATKLPMVEFMGQALVGNQTLNGNLGIFDRQGMALTGLEFEEVQLLENGSMKTTKNGKFGLYDANGSMLADNRFDDLVFWPQVKLFLTEIDGKQGVIDLNGKVLLENKYASVKVYSEQYLSLSLENQLLYFNFKTGKVVKLME
jgi:hypothetical protein